MLQFDIKGHLKPSGLISSDVNETRRYFVENIPSNTRMDNFQKYLKYSDDLKVLLNGQKLRQWINGSFITRKRDPKDIDLVTFIEHQTIKKLGRKLDNFRPELCWSVYGVDAYIIEEYPDGSELYKFTDFDMKEWSFSFSQTRRNRKGVKSLKGFLEIYY